MHSRARLAGLNALFTQCYSFEVKPFVSLSVSWSWFRTFLPGTINGEADPECDLNYLPNESNCIGFGSKNSALVVARGENV